MHRSPEYVVKLPLMGWVTGQVHASVSGAPHFPLGDARDWATAAALTQSARTRRRVKRRIDWSVRSAVSTARFTSASSGVTHRPNTTPRARHREQIAIAGGVGRVAVRVLCGRSSVTNSSRSANRLITLRRSGFYAAHPAPRAASRATGCAPTLTPWRFWGTHGGSSERRAALGAINASYFFTCLAMIWSLILSSLAWGTTFFFTSS